MAKGERDWAQLDSFEAEYAERLAAQRKRRDSQFLTFLTRLARGRETFWSDEVNARDPETGRLFALRGKILGLRRKLGLPEEPLLPQEREIVGNVDPGTARSADDLVDPEAGWLGSKKIQFQRDPLPPGHLYPVAFKEIKAVLAELPAEHVAPIWRIHLSNQRRTGADGDWLEGYIRLHCMVAADGEDQVRYPMARTDDTADLERFGGELVWEGNRPFARWPLVAYKTFLLRRVLIHEIAHGVAELPGHADAVRRAGSVERFCEQYAESFYQPPGPSMRLRF